MHFFFSKLYPYFDLTSLSSIKHPKAERLHPHAVFLFKKKKKLSELESFDPDQTGQTWLQKIILRGNNQRPAYVTK